MQTNVLSIWTFVKKENVNDWLQNEENSSC